MSKVYDEFSRRNLLKYLGNSILFLPVMRTFNETQVFGADVAPRRAVFYYFPSGMIPDRFQPAAGNLSVMPDMIMPLTKVKNDILVIRDSKYNTGGSHQGGMNYALTGLADSKKGPSLDSLLGDKFKGVIPVLRLGICTTFEGGAKEQSCSFDLTGELAVRTDNPTKAFNDLFGGAAPSPSPTPGSPMTPAPATSGLTNKSKRSLLDTNMEQLISLQKKLGTIEKVKLDSHITAVRELERRVDALISGDSGGGTTTTMPGAQCTKKINQTKTFDPNDGSYDAPYKKVEVYNAIADMMVEITIQALACRMTNVVLFQHGHSVFEMGFTAGQPAAGGKGQHSMSHYKAEGTPDGHTANQQYMMSKFANLIEGLGKCAEGDKTVLYNSTMMAFSELGDSELHSMENVPVIIAGQGGGYFKTGRCVSAGGKYHNQTLVSINESFGIMGQSVGDPSIKDPMPGLKG